MSWILAMYLASTPDVYAREFSTEAECKQALNLIAFKEQDNKDLEKLTCTPGIVISDSDEE
jgi:hypothetical protein